jgi:hypothetical protein
MTKQKPKETTENLISRAEFARRQGWNRSRVSQLAKQGRLVVDDDGNVFVAESLARINSTKDLSKISTIQRHAAKRQEKQNSSVDAAMIESIALNTADIVEGSFIDYKTKNEKYKALKAQADYELSVGKLLLVDDVAKVISNAAGIIRSRFEAQPDALAYQLAAITEPARIAATLKEYNENLLNELHKTFKQLAK